MTPRDKEDTQPVNLAYAAEKMAKLVSDRAKENADYSTGDPSADIVAAAIGAAAVTAAKEAE